MIRCLFLGIVGLILGYAGAGMFGVDKWYGIAAILFGSLAFVMSCSAGINKEIELVNRIKELEKRVNQKEDKNENTET